MLTIRHILFPIDFSERTCGAAPFVDAMSTQFGARVTILSVVPPLPYSGFGEPVAPAEFDGANLKAIVQSRLDNSLQKELAGPSVQRIAEIGDPAAVITQFAHNEGVDLIMMPTHGYGPFRRLLLGSVTAKVLHDAHCPVWTGAHIEETLMRNHVACQRVLCAVDGTPKSIPLVKWATQFAGQTRATLRLTHVVPGFESWPERQLDREFEEAARAKARNEIESMIESAGLRAPVCAVAGTVAGSVREEAIGHNADLVVIGRGLIHETLGRLRTHAHAIIREAPCPVISV